MYSATMETEENTHNSASMEVEGDSENIEYEPPQSSPKEDGTKNANSNTRTTSQTKRNALSSAKAALKTSASRLWAKFLSAHYPSDASINKPNNAAHGKKRKIDDGSEDATGLDSEREDDEVNEEEGQHESEEEKLARISIKKQAFEFFIFDSMVHHIIEKDPELLDSYGSLFLALKKAFNRPSSMIHKHRLVCSNCGQRPSAPLASQKEHVSNSNPPNEPVPASTTSIPSTVSKNDSNDTNTTGSSTNTSGGNTNSDRTSQVVPLPVQPRVITSTVPTLVQPTITPLVTTRYGASAATITATHMNKNTNTPSDNTGGRFQLQFKPLLTATPYPNKTGRKDCEVMTDESCLIPSLLLPTDSTNDSNRDSGSNSNSVIPTKTPLLPYYSASDYLEHVELIQSLQQQIQSLQQQSNDVSNEEQRNKQINTGMLNLTKLFNIYPHLLINAYEQLHNKSDISKTLMISLIDNIAYSLGDFVLTTRSTKLMNKLQYGFIDTCEGLMNMINDKANKMLIRVYPPNLPLELMDTLVQYETVTHSQPGHTSTVTSSKRHSQGKTIGFGRGLRESSKINSVNSEGNSTSVAMGSNHANMNTSTTTANTSEGMAMTNMRGASVIVTETHESEREEEEDQEDEEEGECVQALNSTIGTVGYVTVTRPRTAEVAVVTTSTGNDGSVMSDMAYSHIATTLSSTMSTSEGYQVPIPVQDHSHVIESIGDKRQRQQSQSPVDRQHLQSDSSSSDEETDGIAKRARK